MCPKIVLFLAYLVTLILTVSGKDKPADSKNIKPDESIVLGRFELTSSMRAHDFNEFMKALGIYKKIYHHLSFVVTHFNLIDKIKLFFCFLEYNDRDREMARNLQHVLVKIEKEGNKYHLSIHVPIMLMESRFELGKEFPDKLFDGRKLTAVVTMRSATEAQRHETYSHFKGFHIASFTKDGFTASYSVIKKGVTTTARQTFKRVKEDGAGRVITGKSDLLTALVGR